MTDLAVAEAFLRALRWGKPARELLGSKNVLNRAITVYSDPEVTVSMVTAKLRPPRIVVSEIDEDALTVLHPALRCTTTFVNPLLVFASFRREPRIGVSVRRPLQDLINRVLRRRAGDPRERVLGELRAAAKRFPTFVRAVESMDGGEVILVDGSRHASLLPLVSCPSVYGVYRTRRFFIYVGRR